MTATTALTYDHVMEKLPDIVADCLAIDRKDVTPDWVFCEAGDSIDYLDLNFRCEKTFGVKSPFKLFIGSRDELPLDGEGNFTEDAFRLIQETYPFFASKLIATGQAKFQPKDLLDHVTVDMIARFVLHAGNQL